MEPKILFTAALAIGGPTQLTTGPASGKKWIITTLYICNKGAITGTVSIQQGIPIPGATDFELLHTASIQQGETVNIGSIVVENGNDIKGTAASVAFDIIAYGYEDDAV